VAPFGLSSCLPIREKNSFEELPFLTILAGYHLRGFVIFLKSGCKNTVLVGYHMRAFVIFSKRGCKNALLAAYHLRESVNNSVQCHKNCIFVAYHLRSKIFLELVAFCRFKHGLYREQNFKEYPKKTPLDLHR